MRLKHSLMRFMATALIVVMFMTSFGSAASAGLFTKIKDAVKNHPVKTALAGVAAVGGTVLAAPYVAKAIGFASGNIGAVAGGASTAVAAAGTGLAAIGLSIWGGVCAAGGFVTGVLGARFVGKAGQVKRLVRVSRVGLTGAVIALAGLVHQKLDVLVTIFLLGFFEFHFHAQLGTGRYQITLSCSSGIVFVHRHSMISLRETCICNGNGVAIYGDTLLG